VLSARFNGASGMVRIIAPFPDVEKEELLTALFALTSA
jgi:hypothetical protein